MAFLRNAAINRVNAHYAVQSFATASGGLFLLVFLIRAGLSTSQAFLAFAGILAGRFVFRPLVLPLGKRIGLKRLLIFGSFAMAAQYLVVARVHGVGAPLAMFCVVSSLGEALYWPSFHAYFASLGDEEHRGHQIGFREGVAAGLGIVAPLMAAWSLLALGPPLTFALVGVVQALAAIPLLGAPDVAVLPSASGAFRAARMGILLFALDGWMGACFYSVWQVALFVSVHENFAAYGGAMALAAAAGAAASMLLGRHIDQGHGRRSVIPIYAVTAVVIGARAASVGSPWLAALANLPGPIVAATLIPVLMTPAYNLAKASPCALRFHIASEGGWDVGCCSGCLAAAAVTASGLPLTVPLLMALPGMLVLVLVLRRYYGRGADVAAA